MNVKDKNTGDLAVDGLVPGVMAGILMMGVLLLGGILSGVSAETVLGYFAPSSGGAALGLVTHLAVSSVYGLVFSVLAGRFSGRPSSWGIGAVYGLLLYGIGTALVIPGVSAALALAGGGQLLLAHLVYGLALGGLSARRHN